MPKGVPRTTAQRKIRHKAKYGNTKISARQGKGRG